MSNNYFKFKRFTVFQDNCAMKVGTDGTLLGAWANGGKRILDIGTGTGLVALMMAQRFTEAKVVAVDIDENACVQASENVMKSPFRDRVEVVASPIQSFTDGLYDAVVCNPPYFVDSLECPDRQRAVARHASSLSFEDLFRSVHRLMVVEGEFSVVIPLESFSRLDSAAHVFGFRCVRRCAVKTVPRKPVKRVLVAYSRRSDFVFEDAEECIEDGNGNRSTWYASITGDFYLDK